jgi:hypothetical protein
MRVLSPLWYEYVIVVCAFHIVPPCVVHWTSSRAIFANEGMNFLLMWPHILCYAQASPQRGYQPPSVATSSAGGVGGTSGVNWVKIDRWLAASDFLSCYCEVLDRGSLDDLSRLFESTGPKPEVIVVIVVIVVIFRCSVCVI